MEKGGRDSNEGSYPRVPVSYLSSVIICISRRHESGQLNCESEMKKGNA